MNVEQLIAFLQTCPSGLIVSYKDLGTDQQPAYTEAESVFIYNDGEFTFVAIK